MTFSLFILSVHSYRFTLLCKINKKLSHSTGDFWKHTVLTTRKNFDILTMPSDEDLSGESSVRLAKECFEMKKKRKYTKELPRRMYSFFISATEGASPPSFSKFARSVGLTLAELEAMREHSEFERAWRECNEIRRDYLIDTALTRRHDPSFTKFLLAAEFGAGEDSTEDKDISVTLTVID